MGVRRCLNGTTNRGRDARYLSDAYYVHMGKHERFSEQFLGAVTRRNNLLTVASMAFVRFDV